MKVKLTVGGMNCGHCVKALTEELGRVAGVGSLAVEVGAATFTVERLDEAAIRAAVDEAGFEVLALDAAP